MTRKRYNISIPEKYEDEIEQRAKEAGMKPTTYLAQIIAEYLDIQVKNVGNPNFTPKQHDNDS